MRIAFVSFETIHHRETETNARLHGVVDLLRERGHEVHVLCANFWDETDEDGGDEDRGDGTDANGGDAGSDGDAESGTRRRTFERDDVVYHGVADDLESRRSFLLRVPFVLHSIGPDVIHASAQPPTQVLAADVGSTLTRAPLCAEWYGEGGVTNDRHHRWAVGRADRLVAPSQLVRTWLREIGGDGDRIETIPNPVDLERIRETEPGESVDVVYARRLDEEANLESLLLGLAELRDREWTATVLGDGPERDTYERLASDLRIDDRITFAGEADRDERIATYRAAHVFAQTARHCAFPTELLWALACGCIGIVEYHVDSSAHELVEGRDRGFRTTSEGELADAILDAGDLEHREVDEDFAAFDRRPVLERYLQIYRDVQEEYGLL